MNYVEFQTQIQCSSVVILVEVVCLQIMPNRPVKHFKFEERGKRRLHTKPRVMEVHACLPWLYAEIEQTKPDVIVCLGSTAAQALLGPATRVLSERGKLMPSTLAPYVMVTVTSFIHPSQY